MSLHALSDAEDYIKMSSWEDLLRARTGTIAAIYATRASKHNNEDLSRGEQFSGHKQRRKKELFLRLEYRNLILMIDTSTWGISAPFIYPCRGPLLGTFYTIPHPYSRH